MKEFNSSKGLIIYLIYAFSFLIFLLVLLNFFPQKKVNLNIYLLGIILAIILYSISSIKYFLSSRDLIIKIGFLKIRFDLENLEKIYFKKFPALKDKALRLNINFYTDFKNIIVLQFKKVSITISPENPVAFIETLKAYKPDVEIE